MKHFFFPKISLLAILLILFTPLTYSQESALKLEKIMAGNDFIGHQPSNFQWSPSSDLIYFRWNQDKDFEAPYYSYSLKDKSITKLSQINKPPLPVNGFYQDNNKSDIVFKSGNGIYLLSGNETELIYSKSTGYSIKAIIENTLILQERNNLFAFSREKMTYTQLTNFASGSSPNTEDEDENFLEEQQLELFETIRVAKKKEEARKEFRKSTLPQFLNPFYTNKKDLDEMEISNDLSQLVFGLSQYNKNESTFYDRHITKDGYTKNESARAKVGTKNPEHELFYWNLTKDTVISVDFSSLTDLNRIPDFYKNYPNEEIEDYEKEIIFHNHGFNEAGTKCLIEIKSYDNKDRWIGYVETETGKFHECEHQHDESWIGGPGITGWNMVSGNVEWIDNERFYFQSEETGFSHLYSYNCISKNKEALTEGNFEIHEAELSKDKSRFYISANKNHPGNREFYHLELESKELIPILTLDGNHEVIVSPDEKWLLVNYSYKNKPWDLYISPNSEKAALTRITNSTSDSFNSYTWREPEVVTFKASDGTPVNARIYNPDSRVKNGAAVLFVHGAGYLQNAHNWWSGYYREYMFNNLLCDLGYVVMDIDYRASKGYGRDFRTAIYRHMGGKDLSDHVDGRQFLIENYGVDADRVGIYGGSYGGFITIMALLNEPAKFKCGAAIRSVTDWAHYNHPYTSNILNTPETDPAAFKQSSPIYFAENLEDKLLMLHGMVDDNVQYQDVVRLSQRFIELGKANWDLVGYPVEPHGFKETTSWIDEYGRILKLFNEELLNVSS